MKLGPTLLTFQHWLMSYAAHIQSKRLKCRCVHLCLAFVWHPVIPCMTLACFFQGTAITSEMMPSIIRLIELLSPNKLLFVGLSNTQLTKENFTNIIKVLLKKQLRSDANQNAVVLEMQSDHEFDWLGNELSNNIVHEGKRRGITVHLPKKCPNKIIRSQRSRRLK